MPGPISEKRAVAEYKAFYKLASNTHNKHTDHKGLKPDTTKEPRVLDNGKTQLVITGNKNAGNTAYYSTHGQSETDNIFEVTIGSYSTNPDGKGGSFSSVSPEKSKIYYFINPENGDTFRINTDKPITIPKYDHEGNLSGTETITAGELLQRKYTEEGYNNNVAKPIIEQLFSNLDTGDSLNLKKDEINIVPNTLKPDFNITG